MIARTVKRLSLRSGMIASMVVGIVACAMYSADAAVAAETPPVWKLTSVATPTNILAGTPRDEVQEVAVEATGGTFTLSVPALKATGITAALPYNATASEVQSALNAVGGFKVSVTGGPDESSPYEVTFVEGSGNKPVGAIHVNTSSLAGGAHTVNVAETVRGERAPRVVLTATNVGGSATDGSAISIGDILPSGLTVTNISGFDAWASGEGFDGEGEVELNCEAPPAFSCTYGGAVEPGDQLIIVAAVTASPSGLSGLNQASISGGGADEEVVSESFGTGHSPVAPYGPAPDSVVAALSTSQAGAHPDLTTQFAISTGEPNTPPADEKDVRFDLPPGLVGSTVGMPRCSMSRVIELGGNPQACPTDTIVGMVTLTISEVGQSFLEVAVTPLFNIAPSPGEPAAFGFDAVLLPVRLDTSVLSDGDYGVRVTAPDLPESAQTFAASITTWAVPADHNGPGNGKMYLPGLGTFGGPSPGQSRVALLTGPQQCSDPLVAAMSTDSWLEPGVFRSEQASMGMMTGCDQVPFSSSFSFLPDTLEAGAPAGYSFDLDVPQHNEPTGLATSSLKNFKLVLPEGVVVNPSAAWGLKACSDSEFYGSSHPSQEPALPAECPREAQVGEVEVETPDLEHPLKGQVFLGTPECDPCTPADAENGRMVRLLVQLVGEGESGVVVKLEGRADVNQATGQITTVFDDTPQVPFNRLHFVLEGGPRAVLANPRTCGPVKAQGDLTPWSTPYGTDSTPFYEFEIKQGCFGAQFSPSMVSGMTNIQAGEYSPFTLSFSRSDRDQYFGSIDQTLPPGLLGSIASVTPCKEPEASKGTCGSGSLIGHVQVLTGPGADPFLVTGGQVFLTESYEGTPYGLSIVVPAVAGPYTLSGTTGQGTVVVRAKILVDPIDAHLRVVSDPLPSMLDGIPLQLRVVNVTIDKPGFTFNPTNCGKLAIGATLRSTGGLSASVSSPFQVTNCARLGFKPSLTASTSGKPSRKNGTSLTLKLAYPKGTVLGSEAWFRQAKFDFPKQLPARLTTLQKACPAATFEANPASCSPGSRAGTATVNTPVLPDELHGVVYFVSYGGAKFPEAVIVLQADGVTVDLHAETFISKTGVTSATLRSIPGVPFNAVQVNLPAGPNSEFAANGNPCKTKLTMPIAFTAQNGASIHQNTKINVTGCPKTKKKTKKTSRHNKNHKK